MSWRLFFGLALLAGLFYFVGATELLAALYRIKFIYVFYLLLLAVVMIWASCLKWQLFVRAAGHEASISELMTLYTIGYFFNTFTPSYVGGDVARSFHLGKQLDSQRDAFVATFLERFTGLLAMALLGVSFVALGAQATAGVEAAILIVGLGATVLALACFSERLRTFGVAFCIKCIRLLPAKSFTAKLERLVLKIDAGLQEARTDVPLLWRAMLLSLFFHVLTVVNTYVAALAVGWQEPNFAGLFVVVPLVLLVSMVPLTPGGLAIQEGAFLFFLKRVGASSAEALAVGVVLRAKVMLIAMLGGLLWLRLRKREQEAVAA